MKTILLLGAYGFIGTNIIKYFEKNNDYGIITFDRLLKHIDNISFSNVVKSYSGDFCDEFVLEQIFLENKIDIVIHSISASIPSASKDNVFDLLHNVVPTIKLLDIMRKYGVVNIVFISSGGAVYGDCALHESGHRETDDPFPKSAYGLSKLTIEKYLFMYSKLYGINSLILRLSNPYGPYHYSQKQGIVNIALERALGKIKFEIWGNGEGVKDYIYIEDFCKILFSLMERGIEGYTILNVGSGEQLSVNQIVSKIKVRYANDFQYIYKNMNSLDVLSFKLDLEKLLGRFVNLKFTPFDAGLEKTYDWYKSVRIK